MKTATSNLRLHAYCHFKVKQPVTFLSSFFIIFFKMNFSFGFELNNDVHLKMWSMQFNGLGRYRKSLCKTRKSVCFKTWSLWRVFTDVTSANDWLINKKLPSPLFLPVTSHFRMLASINLTSDSQINGKYFACLIS